VTWFKKQKLAPPQTGTGRYNILTAGFYENPDGSGPLHSTTKELLRRRIALCGKPVGRRSEAIAARVCLQCWRVSLLNELARVEELIREEE
jgi:hypothetical protein